MTLKFDVVSLKHQADNAVARKDWTSAVSLYLRALRANEHNEEDAGELEKESPDLVAKITANLSFVMLNLTNFDQAIKYGKSAVSRAPSWGKAYARLGAAQQSNGHLLDAADSYNSALTAEDKFTGCRKVHSELIKSKRYCKMALSHKAKQSEGSGGAIGIDLVVAIATYLESDNTLHSLCVAVGPIDANSIRKVYLFENERYVELCLFRLHTIPNLNGLYGSEGYYQNIRLFDKCRDNIVAWMEVNKNWRERCTQENTTKYSQGAFPGQHLFNSSAPATFLDISHVFSNPAIAIEIGLLDVLRVLVEEGGIDVNLSIWPHFKASVKSNGWVVKHDLISLAATRGDVHLLEYLLSRPELNEGALLLRRLPAILPHIQDASLSALVGHPIFDVNSALDDSIFELNILTGTLRSSERETRAAEDSADMARIERTIQGITKGIDHQVRGIATFLNAGADPRHPEGFFAAIGGNRVGYSNAIGYARKARKKIPAPHWNFVVAMMEETIASLDRE
jgi:hypothetical protein